MRRRETSNERETQLDAWDRRLEERQRELDTAIAEFRGDVRRETSRLLEKEEALLGRAMAVKGREEAVSKREAAVLDALEALNGKMDQWKSSMLLSATLTAAAAAQQEAVVTEASSRSSNSPTGSKHTSASGTDAALRSGTGPSQTAPGSLPSAAVAASPVSSASPAALPQLQQRPAIPTLGLKGMSKVVPDASSGSPSKPLTGGARTDAEQQPRGTRGGVPASPPAPGGTSSDSSRRRTRERALLYEGPVDLNVASHVELIPSDESSGTPTPRGLRASPQFTAMDPNDSGLFFFRGAHRKESSRLHGMNTQMQEQLDNAIEYLLGNGLLSEEQIEEILSQSNPQAVVELYQHYLAENQDIMLGDEEGLIEEEEEEDDMFGREGFDEEDEEEEEDAAPQFYHDEEGDEEGEEEEDYGGGRHDDEEAEDGGNSRRRLFVAQSRYDEDDSQEEEEVRMDDKDAMSNKRQAAEDDDVEDPSAAHAAASVPSPVQQSVKHAYDDFDND